MVVKHYYNLEKACEKQWNYHSAFFFAGTVATTIGYGTMVPVTIQGKIFCMIFMVIDKVGKTIWKWIKLCKNFVIVNSYRRLHELFSRIKLYNYEMRFRAESWPKVPTWVTLTCAAVIHTKSNIVNNGPLCSIYLSGNTLFECN